LSAIEQRRGLPAQSNIWAQPAGLVPPAGTAPQHAPAGKQKFGQKMGRQSAHGAANATDPSLFYSPRPTKRHALILTKHAHPFLRWGGPLALPTARPSCPFHSSSIPPARFLNGSMSPKLGEPVPSTHHMSILCTTNSGIDHHCVIVSGTVGNPWVTARVLSRTRAKHRPIVTVGRHQTHFIPGRSSPEGHPKNAGRCNHRGNGHINARAD